ncbi:MAG: hypothetical protein R2880_12640 [Deinococcales bacterium]
MSKFLSLLSLLFALFLGACAELNVNDNPIDISSLALFKTEIYAGQHILVGELEVNNDSNNLYITYKITDLDWCMTQVHIYVDTKDPYKAAPGQFAYKDSLNCISEYKQTLALSDLGFSDGDGTFVAAHAVVKSTSGQTETAWAKGMRNFKTGWGSYFGYLIGSNVIDITQD